MLTKHNNMLTKYYTTLTKHYTNAYQLLSLTLSLYLYIYIILIIIKESKMVRVRWCKQVFLMVLAIVCPCKIA
jgi:hypothetical protein